MAFRGKRVLTFKIRKRLYPWALVAGLFFFATQAYLLLIGSTEVIGSLWEIVLISLAFVVVIPLGCELGDFAQASPLNVFNWY